MILTKDEKSLLMFFETALVEHKGCLDITHMTPGDVTLAKKWNSSGYAGFGHLVPRGRTKNTHWCSLSVCAWNDAHNERYARAQKTYFKRHIK